MSVSRPAGTDHHANAEGTISGRESGLPSVLSSPNQPSRTISSIPSMCWQCTSRSTAHASKYRFNPCIPMCPSQNFRCNVTWLSIVINAAPHLSTTKNVNIKIHAPTAKQSKDVGDTCECSASEKAQVCDPTPQQGARSRKQVSLALM